MATGSDFDDLVDVPELATDDNAGAGANEGGDAQQQGNDDNDAGNGEGDQGDKDKAEGAQKPSKDEGDDGDDEGQDPKDAKEGKKDQTMVPKAALDSTKRRLRETAARLKKIEERFQVQDAEAAKAAIPDKETQPLAYAEYMIGRQAAISANDKLNMSEFNAREAHGDDIVDQAFDWANTQMAGADGEKFKADLLSHPSPYHYAVKLFNDAQAASKGGGASAAAAQDPEYAAFLEWKASKERGSTAKVENQQQPAQKRPTSLAQTPSASGPRAPAGIVDPFESEFDR